MFRSRACDLRKGQLPVVSTTSLSFRSPSVLYCVSHLQDTIKMAAIAVSTSLWSIDLRHRGELADEMLLPATFYSPSTPNRSCRISPAKSSMSS
jgi:hypothetical protein